MNRTATQYTLRGLRINNAALAAPELPKRIKLLNWGTNDSTKGGVVVNQLTVEHLARNQREQGFERVAIDFDHNSLPGSDTYEKGKPIKIAGYGSPRVIEGDGLYLEDVEWTPAGQEFARNYKDLSPAPGLDQAGVVLFLHSAALTPNGSVYDLEFFAAKSNPPNMESKPITLVALSTFLGLPETATEADITARLKSFTPDLKPITDQIAALSSRIEAISKSPADAGLVARITALEAASSASALAREQGEREQLIADASREGKVLPLSADQIKLVPLSALREMVAKLPKTVPMVARGNATGDTNTGNVCAFSAAVANEVKAGKSKAQAIRDIIAKSPELYAEYRQLGVPAL